MWWAKGEERCVTGVGGKTEVRVGLREQESGKKNIYRNSLGTLTERT